MRGDRLAAALLVGAAVIGAGGVAAHVATAAPSAPSTTVDVASSTPGQVTLQFGGDTMLADGALDTIAAKGFDHPLAKVAPLLTGDYVIVNAEAPLTTRDQPPKPGKKFTYNVDPAAAPALRDAGVDGLDLANNHVMDRGPEGLADTLRTAEAAGLTTVGAGPTLTSAQAPLVLRTAAGTVAITSLGENFGASSRATAETPGIPFITPEQARRSYAAGRAAGADRVIAFVHWGDNYADVVDLQRIAARTLVDAGFDAIIGSGSHTVQPVEMVGGVPVVYSMGNFVFGSPGRYDSFGAYGAGLLVSLTLRESGPATLSATCLRTDNLVVAYQPRPCTLAEARKVLGTSPALTVDARGVGHVDLAWRAATG